MFKMKFNHAMSTKVNEKMKEMQKAKKLQMIEDNAKKGEDEDTKSIETDKISLNSNELDELHELQDHEEENGEENELKLEELQTDLTVKQPADLKINLGDKAKSELGNFLKYGMKMKKKGPPPIDYSTLDLLSNFDQIDQNILC